MRNANEHSEAEAVTSVGAKGSAESPVEHGEVDLVALEAARRLRQARAILRAALQETNHDDPDFPRLLKAVHDMKIVTASELAEWVGLSRGRMYDRIREVDG